MTLARRSLPPVRPSRRQAGVTLVELMVALTIGLFIVAGLGYIYVSSARVIRSLEASSRLQEQMRHAFERISSDVRMAGFAGCSFQTSAVVLNDSAAWQFDLFQRPLRGYEEGVDSFPADFGAARLRGDALVVLRADNSKEYMVASHNATAAQLSLAANHDVKQGQILLATDCSHAALFQMTNVNNNNTVNVIVHNTGSGSPGNCTKGFGLPVDCTDPNGTPYAFAPGSRVFRFSGSAYYVRRNPNGEPALYREALQAAGGNAQLAPEELVEGIEDMQVTYGVDTSSPADNAVDVYTTAPDVLAQAPGVTEEEKWRRVLALRVSVLAVSDQAVNAQPVRYRFDGVSVTPTDRRMRKVFTTTIAIRNRL